MRFLSGSGIQKAFMKSCAVSRCSKTVLAHKVSQLVTYPAVSRSKLQTSKLIRLQSPGMECTEHHNVHARPWLLPAPICLHADFLYLKLLLLLHTVPLKSLSGMTSSNGELASPLKNKIFTTDTPCGCSCVVYMPYMLYMTPCNAFDLPTHYSIHNVRIYILESHDQN